MIEIDLRHFQNLLLKSKTDEKVSELLDALGAEFVKSEFPTKYYQVYEKLGIDLLFNKEHYLQTIFVYQKSTEFLKMLTPYGLNLSLKMKEVEDILGIPERSGGASKTMNYWVAYPEKGIILSYQTKEKDNLEAPIHYISFHQPENELSRIRFITKSEVHMYFQARSSVYSASIVADILKLEPNRIDENDTNLYEVYLTRNPHLTVKTQLAEVMSFLDSISPKVAQLPDQVNLKLKINVISFRSNAVRFRVLAEHIRKLENLRIEIEFEFMT